MASSHSPGILEAAEVEAVSTASPNAAELGAITPARFSAPKPFIARHLTQLDSLRAFAVFAVMIHHFWHELTFDLPLGHLGVWLFFVLSGFLITGILLDCRGIVESGRRGRRFVIGRFYARRFLRIFPLFYATLGIAWLLGVTEVRDSIAWHASYTTNIYFARLGYWRANTSHLWSLAVEEQFYLIWPVLIVFTPRRALLAVLCAVAAVGPAFRLIGNLMAVHWMAVYTLPFSCLDSLAIGGVLAYASRAESRDGRPKLVSGLAATGLWIGAPAVVLLCLASRTGFLDRQLSLPRAVFEDTIWAVFFVWLIQRAVGGFGGVIGRILELPPLVYLGKISYGLYVIHVFMMRGVPWVFSRAGWTYPDSHPLQFVILVLATVSLAACSWHFYERPLNDLKRFVAYG